MIYSSTGIEIIDRRQLYQRGFVYFDCTASDREDYGNSIWLIHLPSMFEVPEAKRLCPHCGSAINDTLIKG